MKHIHHIIPRHMGGDNSPENLIEISVSEHAEEHRKLFEKYGKHEDKVAWKGLTAAIDKDKIFFETSRIGGLNNRGIKKSKEHRQKLSESNKGKWLGSHSQERKKKISEAMKGNKSSKNHSSPEYKKVQSEAMKKAWAKRKQKLIN
jgi:hypothetical protein